MFSTRPPLSLLSFTTHDDVEPSDDGGDDGRGEPTMENVERFVSRGVPWRSSVGAITQKKISINKFREQRSR